jgi:hypothetical protein
LVAYGVKRGRQEGIGDVRAEATGQPARVEDDKDRSDDEGQDDRSDRDLPRPNGSIANDAQPEAAAEEGWVDEEFDGDEETVEDDGVPEDDRQSEEEEDGGEYHDTEAERQEVVGEELPPVTDDHIEQADAFVGAVGGPEHAARALVARSVRSGDKDGVKITVAEVVRAANALLTSAEIGEIVIVGNAKEKGIKWVSV